MTCTSKTIPIDAETRWQEVFSKSESQIPRVCKRCIEDSELLSLVQQLVPDKLVVPMMACRGALLHLLPTFSRVWLHYVEASTPNVVQGKLDLKRNGNNGKNLPKEILSDHPMLLVSI